MVHKVDHPKESDIYAEIGYEGFYCNVVICGKWCFDIITLITLFSVNDSILICSGSFECAEIVNLFVVK